MNRFIAAILIVGLCAAAVGAEKKSEAVTLSGQAFAKGIDQPYRFAGMVVGIYRSTPSQSIDAPLPEPMLKTTTDADGNFSIKSVGKYGILYARAERSYRTGSKAVYEWTLDISTLKPEEVVMLTGENAKITPRTNRWPN